MHNCLDHDVCIESALSRAEEICSLRGVRFTVLRRHIFRMICSSHTPVKAYRILDNLRDLDFCARPPTVYRTLDFLLAHGLIHRLSSLNAYIGCSHPLTHSGCYFLICSDCGEIKECCNKDLSGSIWSVASDNFFHISRVTLEIEGYCSDCVRKH